MFIFIVLSIKAGIVYAREFPSSPGQETSVKIARHNLLEFGSVHLSSVKTKVWNVSI